MMMSMIVEQERKSAFRSGDSARRRQSSSGAIGSIVLRSMRDRQLSLMMMHYSYHY